MQSIILAIEKKILLLGHVAIGREKKIPYDPLAFASKGREIFFSFHFICSE
jgi:hypothetical protein